MEVRRLRKFNLTLIGKWCWRVLEERDCLWYRVLKVCYKEEEEEGAYVL